MDIGKRRRTIYVEPIEEPPSPQRDEPTPAIDPQPSDPLPGTERELEPAR